MRDGDPPVPPGCPLTSGQLAVLTALSHGQAYKQIALARGVAWSTIRQQAHDAYARLGATGAAHAVAILIRNGWDRSPGSPAPPPQGRCEEPLPAFMAAYSEQLDRWLASGMRDEIARNGMRIALLGATNTRAGGEPPKAHP